MSKVQAKAPAGKAVTAPAAKSAPPPPAKKAFDVKDWARNGVSEEEVAASKQAFDLFDSDQGGTVDISGNSCLI
jgi:hypothetical protein